MFFAGNENPIGSIEDAIRKGKVRGYRAPCKVGVATLVDDPQTVVLRTQDANGVAPIVICLNKNQAKELASFLLR
jgi:hypothetical protein